MLVFHHSERDHSISRHQGNHLRSKGNEVAHVEVLGCMDRDGASELQSLF